MDYIIDVGLGLSCNNFTASESSDPGTYRPRVLFSVANVRLKNMTYYNVWLVQLDIVLLKNIQLLSFLRDSRTVTAPRSRSETASAVSTLC